MAHPGLREQVALTDARVRDEFARSGAVPGELIRFIQAEVAKRGRILTLDQARELVGEYSSAWSAVLLEETDRRKADQDRMGRSKREQIRRVRQKIADERAERKARVEHRPSTMITVERKV